MPNTPYDTLEREWKEYCKGEIIDPLPFMIDKMKARDLALREAIEGKKIDMQTVDWHNHGEFGKAVGFNSAINAILALLSSNKETNG